MSWRAATLKDLVFLQRGFDITKAQQKPGDVPVISSSGFKSRHSEAKVEGPGVVIGRKGTLGSVFYSERDFWPHDTTLWSKELHGNNPRFVFYFLKTLRLENFNVGNANPTLNRNHIHDLEIRIPDLSTQNEIADILSGYDDLIENNRRRMVLLEESARLLYREWFVHLRFPGHEHVPVTDCVPEGWEKKPLNTFLEIKHGYAFKGKDFSEEPTSRVLLTPGNFKIGGGLNLKKLKFYNDDGPLDEGYLLKQDDLVVTMTDLSKSSDTLGFSLLVPNLEGKAFLHNQRTGLVTAKDEAPFFRFFLDQLFRDPSYRGFVVGAASGVAVKHTSPKKILAYQPVLPPMEENGLIQIFDKQAKSLTRQIHGLIQMNEKLIAARDLLLPRLMKGELAA